MKKSKILKKVFAVFLSAVLLGSALFLIGCNENVETVVKNADFEESSTGIAGWEFSDYQNDTFSNGCTEFSVGEGASGGNAAVIESNQLNDARIYQSLAVAKKSYYKISVDIKTENVEGGAGAVISAIGASERTEGIFGTTDWQTVTIYVKTAKKQGTLELSLGLGGYSADSKGKVWFDNLSVEQVSSVPSGETTYTFFKDDTSSKATIDLSSNSSSTWLKLLFAGLLIALIVFVVVLGFKSDKDERKGLKAKEVARKLDKTDFIIIGILTVVCACFSFFQLGDTDTANTYWKSGSQGEYVIGEFDSVRTVTGMSHLCNIPTTGAYSVYYEKTDGAGDWVHAFTISNSNTTETESGKVQGSFYAWTISKKVNFTTKRVKVVCDKAGWAVNEIGFLEKDSSGNYSVIPLTVADESYVPSAETRPSMIFDEQDNVQVDSTYMNGTYFDEIYHVRTAYEMIHGLKIYETTHPPLGKAIIGLGIRIFGMNPFGWRFMGTLFGVLMVPLMYLFAAKIFKKRRFAILAASLIAVDFMRLAHSRLATIDSYSTFFIMLMYYFMYDYFLIKSYDPKDIKARIPLALCGIVFGIGAATKWTCLYAGAGLALLFFAAQFFEAKDVSHGKGYPIKNVKNWLLVKFLPTCAGCVVFFVLIPAAIYTLSYLPYMPSNPNSDLVTVMLNNQTYMFNYHSQLTATHPYSSSWWSWLLDLRPIWLNLSDSAAGNRSTIASFGNPAIWMLSIPALVASIYYCCKKKDKKMLVIFTAFALEFLPWILVTRAAFIYHYMPCVPFIILMIAYCFDNLIEDKALPKWSVWVYIGICTVLLGIFYPVLTGLEVKESYVEGLRWFSSWYF